MEPCNPEIYKNGHMVMMTHSIPSAQLEEWVKKVAAASGQPVDWHFAAGRACILALGDLTKVYAAIADLMDEHNALQVAAGVDHPSYELYAPNEINTAHEFIRAVNTERED